MMADILLDNLNVFGRLLRSLSLKGNMLSVTDLSYDRQLRPCGRGAGDQYGPSPTDSTDACNINGVDDRTIGDTVLKWNKVTAGPSGFLISPRATIAAPRHLSSSS
mmetsp:Transcript_14248/g.14059  ORF Transcript_14248/g.14059 Transcript_14248/m.14059 type:complete len:106 (-) Transcript_14248:128-445(-)